MPPQSTLKIMDFKLHQLSAENLASIFNAAYMDAEAPEDSSICIVEADVTQFIGACNEGNFIRFGTQLRPPEGLNEEDLHKLITAFNEELNLVKVNIRKDDDDDLFMTFQYDYVVLKHDTISAKTLVQLSRMFDDSMNYSYSVYGRLFAAQAQ